ncbi:hypothetical protein DAI22_12g069400 [Oryza sativa Japonica Group]|nr:hypothetical protein DAI22_12g069400 [Oryza sativa Japonica Group]
MRWMRDLMACLASNHTKHEHAQEKQSARAIVTHSLTPHVQMAWLPPCSSMATCHTHLSLSLSLITHTHTHTMYSDIHRGHACMQQQRGNGSSLQCCLCQRH